MQSRAANQDFVQSWGASKTLCCTCTKGGCDQGCDRLAARHASALSMELQGKMRSLNLLEKAVPSSHCICLSYTHQTSQCFFKYNKALHASRQAGCLIQGMDIATSVGMDVATSVGMDIATSVGMDVETSMGMDVVTSVVGMDVATSMGMDVATGDGRCNQCGGDGHCH